MKIKNISKRIYIFNSVEIHPGQIGDVPPDLEEYARDNPELEVQEETASKAKQKEEVIPPPPLLPSEIQDEDDKSVFTFMKEAMEAKEKKKPGPKSKKEK